MSGLRLEHTLTLVQWSQMGSCYKCRAQMLKLKAGLPGSTRPSLDASPRIVSSLRISDAIMSGREMAEESFVTLRTNSGRPRQLLVVFKSLHFRRGGLVIVAFRCHDPTRSMRCQYANRIKLSFSTNLYTSENSQHASFTPGIKLKGRA